MFLKREENTLSTGNLIETPNDKRIRLLVRAFVQSFSKLHSNTKTAVADDFGNGFIRQMGGRWALGENTTLRMLFLESKEFFWRLRYFGEKHELIQGHCRKEPIRSKKINGNAYICYIARWSFFNAVCIGIEIPVALRACLQ